MSMCTEGRGKAVTTVVFLTTVRTFVTLTFGFGTGVALQASLQPSAESVHLETVGEEELVASGTLESLLGVIHLSALVCDCLYSIASVSSKMSLPCPHV